MCDEPKKPNGGSFWRLEKCVVDASDADSWDAAVREWKIIGASEDSHQESTCVCGQKHIKRLFRIRNVITGKVLYPIGSDCIKRFGNDTLSERLALLEELCNLMDEVVARGWDSWKVVGLSSKRYSRKLLAFMFEHGAFVPTQYNDGCPYKDYQFMLSMFNKRSEETVAQERKEAAVIRHQIYPWLKKYRKAYDRDEPMVFNDFAYDCCNRRRKKCGKNIVDYDYDDEYFDYDDLYD